MTMYFELIFFKVYSLCFQKGMTLVLEYVVEFSMGAKVTLANREF